MFPRRDILRPSIGDDKLLSKHLISFRNSDGVDSFRKSFKVECSGGSDYLFSNNLLPKISYISMVLEVASPSNSTVNFPLFGFG